MYQYVDVITACQCFWYFDHETVMPKFYRMLKQGGSILVIYMVWLPFEDEIAGASEKLVLNLIQIRVGRRNETSNRHPRLLQRKL